MIKYLILSQIRVLPVCDVQNYICKDLIFYFSYSSLIFIYCFVVRGESPDCRLFGTASMLDWLRNHLPHHSHGGSTERWSRNTLRVVTARVFYVISGFLTSPFILNNSVETAAPFNVVSHPRCCEPRN